MAQLVTSLDARSIGPVLQELRYLDRKMYQATEKALKKAADPLVKDVREAFPDKVLSGMMVLSKTSQRKRGPYPVYKRGEVRRQVNSKVGGRRRSKESNFPVLKITQRNGAAMIFDMAQNQRTPHNTLSANLIAKYGDASRIMWPTVRKNVYKVEDAIREELGKAEQLVITLTGGRTSQYRQASARASAQIRSASGRFGLN